MFEQHDQILKFALINYMTKEFFKICSVHVCITKLLWMIIILLEGRVGRTCWSVLLIQPWIAFSCQAALAIHRLYFRGLRLDQHVLCSILEDCLSKVHCIHNLCSRPVIVLTESICRRPASSCHYFLCWHTCHGCCSWGCTSCWMCGKYVCI